MSSLNKNPCGGCGKGNHSIYFYGNVQKLNAEDIETWLRSINSPPFVHVNKKDGINNVRYGVVHCDTHEDACIFFHKMKHKKFIGPFNTSIKFYEARDFVTKLPIKYEEIKIPLTSVTNSTSDDPMILSTPAESSGHPKKDCNDEQFSPATIDLTVEDATTKRLAKKKNNSSGTKCTKLAREDEDTSENEDKVEDKKPCDSDVDGDEYESEDDKNSNGENDDYSQVEFLKTKIINLQDELLRAQKEIITYQRLTIHLNVNDHEE
ncbi:hypothetical protein C1645_742042 [Glomus cerebriforme]|uniref:RRM domain-containing protein n=1 Tax=Glomus cerebriforme TaxID=658196 RepID=A0A397SFN1_9GLOM|nr:hypothetical protein C1645_742042 [Glomus cerebriforme]